MFIPKLNSLRISEIYDKLEVFQKEMERIHLNDNYYQTKERLNTLQENLTRVNMETVEDMPFSRFLVRISHSYYQTIGKFTR